MRRFVREFQNSSIVIDRLTPDDWAARNRTYGPHTGVPGPRNPFHTPYMVPWGRAIQEGKHARAVMCCAAQMGKSDEMLDCIGERLDNKPAPILYVGPSKEFCTDQFEPRVMQLLDEAPSISDKLLRGKRNKKTRKLISGVPLRLAHAGSSTALKSDPAAIAFVDEYDEMLANVKNQGDPLGLVEARGNTYADFTTAIASTPSIGELETEIDPGSELEFWKWTSPEFIESPIWKLWQDGTRHHWCWKCPHCGEFFVPRFSRLKWESRPNHTTTPEQAGETAYVECVRCGGVITDAHKKEMNATGVFIAPGQRISGSKVIGQPENNSTISFWVSGLASPFTTFGKLARDYVRAVRSTDRDRIQTVINAGLGELFARVGADAPAYADVAAHKSDYSLTEVPEGVMRVTLTVDVQGDRLYYLLRGWGARATSWLIDFGTLFGSTVEENVWVDLDDLVKSDIGGHSIHFVMIDSGFRPGKITELPINRIYEFCRRHHRNVRATKGSSFPMRVPLIKSRIEVTPRGNAAKYGLELLRLDTDYFKSRVHERIHWPIDAPGSWYLPQDVTDDYCSQVIAEARTKLPTGRPLWVQKSSMNHALDLEAMQEACSHLLNFNRLSNAHKERTYKSIAGAGGDLMQQRSATISQTVEERGPSITRVGEKQSFVNRLAGG